jgi:hypothetical protein
MASIEQTSTYLKVTAVGLRESMRKSDEARTRCNSVANEAETGLPLARNDNEENGRNSTVN